VAGSGRPFPDRAQWTSFPAVQWELPAVQCSFPAVQWELPAVRCSFPAVQWELPAVQCSFPAVQWELPVVHWKLTWVQWNPPVVQCDFTWVQWELPAVQWELPAVQWELPVFQWELPVFQWKLPAVQWKLLVDHRDFTVDPCKLAPRLRNAPPPLLRSCYAPSRHTPADFCGKSRTRTLARGLLQWDGMIVTAWKVRGGRDGRRSYA
jgi:hypothetical protein